MADVKPEIKPETRKFEVSPALIVIALAVLAGVGIFGWLTFAPKPAGPPAPVLTADAKAYLPFLKLSDVEPQTSESYIQKSLFEIMGKITDTGPKTISDVEVTCVFHDYTGREIKRELVSVVGTRGGPLSPNTTKPFRLAFDDLPDDWDRQMPAFVIAQIRFQ